MPKILLTQGVMDEYAARCVFNGLDGYPEVPYDVGVHDIEPTIIQAMLNDALHFVGPDAPDAMPLSERRIYASLVKRCQKALRVAA
jgi:hypothetical protein